jgi:mannose-6-phosphate isomerase-like protein (cupin superfamily)
MVRKGYKVEKGWGYEIIIINGKDYCGKILHFNEGGKFSMHYHMIKDETWYVNEGSFVYKWIDTNTGNVYEEQITPGDVIHIRPGSPHQLIALIESEIFEVSTEHHDEDSYRIWKGDSQR